MSDSTQITGHQMQDSKAQLAADHPLQKARELVDASDQSASVLRNRSDDREQSSASVLKPFYSIISDTTVSSSTETYYPRVRYIFTDDDPDLLTDTFGPWQGQDRKTSSDNSTSPINQQEPSRSILVDLELSADGRKYAIARATSLSMDWAVKDAQLQSLRTSPSTDSSDNEGDNMIVLHVEGLGLPVTSPSTSNQVAVSSPATVRGEPSLPRDGKIPDGEQDYSELLGSFERRMAVLQRVAHNPEEDRE